MKTENASVSEADIDKARKEGAQAARDAEKTRRTAIRLAFQNFSEHKALMDECLDDAECTVEAAREKLLAALAPSESELPQAPASIIPGTDSRDKFVEGAGLALAMRSGLEQRDIGNEFVGMTLCQLAAESLARAGISVRGLTQDGIARKVLGAHSTSDFPRLLSNQAGKMLRQAYTNFPNTYQQIAYIGQVSDFKAHDRIQIGSFNNLETIPEGGEYKAGTLDESYEVAQADTKGRMIKLTRQMIVNDDLGGLNRRAGLMGRAAARSVNVDFYTFVTSGTGNNGPTSTDTTQYFHADHNNLAGSGAAPSPTTIAAGRTGMRKQKDVGNKETLNILPAVILAPVALEDTIWTIINSATDVTQANPNKRNYVADVARLELVTDPFLDGVSTTAWYLFADPNDAAAGFEVVFLDGVQEPFIDDMIDFFTDSMNFKVRLDYGIAIGDWRGGWKNAGA